MENKFIVQHRSDNIVVNCRSLKPILEGWDLNGIEFGVMAPDGLKGIGLESRDMNSGICNGKLRDVFKETGYPRVELSDETPTYDYTEEIRSLESKCNKLNECINVNTVPRNINELLLLNASDVEELLNYRRIRQTLWTEAYIPNLKNSRQMIHECKKRITFAP